MNILGLDIGACKIFYIVYNSKTKRVVFESEKKYKQKTRREFITQIKEILQKGREYKVKKIGVCIAGIVNRGRLVYSPNFKALENLNLNKLFPQGTMFENDANCFALAESVLGVGRGKKWYSILGLTLGSGLGGGFIFKLPNANCQLPTAIYHGAFGGGIEIGHTIMQIKNIEAEELCSEKFFTRKGLDPKEEEIKARKGNKKSLRIYQEFGKNLGIFCANMINILEPEIIVFGGGISSAFDLFESSLKQKAKKFIVNPKNRTKFLKSVLHPRAGAMGAIQIVN